MSEQPQILKDPAAPGWFECFTRGHVGRCARGCFQSQPSLGASVPTQQSKAKKKCPYSNSHQDIGPNMPPDQIVIQWGFRMASGEDIKTRSLQSHKSTATSSAHSHSRPVRFIHSPTNIPSLSVGEKSRRTTRRNGMTSVRIHFIQQQIQRKRPEKGCEEKRKSSRTPKKKNERK